MQKGTFNHSVKVPKLYKCAAKIAQDVAGGAGSIKQLVYEKKHFNTKALYALVAKAFQKSQELELLFKRTKLLEKESRLDPWLAKILISELLWGKKQLPQCEAKPVLTILGYEQAFKAHLSDSTDDFISERLQNQRKPRYIRINTLMNPLNEALELFQEEGWILQPSPPDYNTFLEQISSLEENSFMKDFHIPDVLVFPAGTEFYKHPGYKKGVIVLQDKASCLPVYILNPSKGSTVLDMCAAPGMKTTQIASLLQNDGTVYAVERDAKRFEVLKKMVESADATCVKPINKDVLQCGETDFPDVEFIIVDPSCSGSGMVDRFEVAQSKEDPFRLQKLAGFQIKILRNALSRYQKVKRVVYSTCSLYSEENEDVVRQVLETNSQFKLVPAGQFLGNHWSNYGSKNFGKIGEYCVYAKPEEDLTNGFFLAVFERLQEGETNEFYNGRVLNYRKNIEQKQARKEKRKRESLGDDMRNSDVNQEFKQNGDGSEKNQFDKKQILITEEQEVDVGKKKKKKKHKQEVDVSDGGPVEELAIISEDIKKSKMHKEKFEEEKGDTSQSKSNKKKHKYGHDDIFDNNTVQDITIDEPVKKKKHKKDKSIDVNEDSMEDDKKSKKKNKSKKANQK
ncbi:28S rRNA (cytosine-C(5))-methyltransferase [Anthonomus grandis grandis]|uniref:28S rRNA (cytosine-C(5))-methyltransferase n=1 Tax=Anthonomus grandis grandis TaxID=2921223 RepID=UPI0021655957|nr:28S rRNA (cytosine-C(5))-methyltransferase [Anthonomus grandis grandis]